MQLLGIDTGGTFTDFVFVHAGQLTIHKVLSTPHAPEVAITRGFHDLAGTSFNNLQVIHGSTVATNAVLEGKGARTVFITNHGLRDLLTIGRQARKELYNLQPKPSIPPVPQTLCLTSGGRLSATGETLIDLTEDELFQLRQQIIALAPQAVAINLLFSYLDDTFEKRIAAIIPADIFTCRSSEVLPEYKEYERGISTWLNAYVGPLLKGYLNKLSHALAPGKVTIMQSSGGTMSLSQASQRGVNLLLSGPAGGLKGAQFIGKLTGQHQLLTFDMGGTSTDVALLNGEIKLTNQGQIAGYPVAVPMIDMHTIGAGGGSIAYVDEGGLLQVGPQSAGASPGPACYGNGGQQATVTDANLVLGRLLSEYFLGGQFPLNKTAALQAITTMAKHLNCTREAAAYGIIRLANEHMISALRVMTVNRGIDPRHFCLMSFGGAGGLHICALAEALEIKHAIVPIYSGVLSALGMLVAPHARELSRTLGKPLHELTDAILETEFKILENQGINELIRDDISTNDIQVLRSADLRYRGQSYTINISWQPLAQLTAAFHATHQARYGHSLEEPIELVNARAGLRGPDRNITLPHLPKLMSTPKPITHSKLIGHHRSVPIWERKQLHANQKIQGPALIVEQTSTTYLTANWQCDVDNFGNLLLAFA